MTEKEFNVCIGKILAGKGLSEEDAINFVEDVNEMQSMLDDGDQEDYFGSEGWRHRMGWD
jgi:hypothetical protein